MARKQRQASMDRWHRRVRLDDGSTRTGAQQDLRTRKSAARKVCGSRGSRARRGLRHQSASADGLTLKRPRRSRQGNVHRTRRPVGSPSPTCTRCGSVPRARRSEDARPSPGIVVEPSSWCSVTSPWPTRRRPSSAEWWPRCRSGATGGPSMWRSVCSRVMEFAVEDQRSAPIPARACCRRRSTPTELPDARAGCAPGVEDRAPAQVSVPAYTGPVPVSCRRCGCRLRRCAAGSTCHWSVVELSDPHWRAPKSSERRSVPVPWRHWPDELSALMVGGDRNDLVSPTRRATCFAATVPGALLRPGCR